MKKNKLLLGLLLISSSMLFGQSFLGGHFSTKDAILSNSLNPAAGIAGDMKWQVNLIGFSTEAGNNYFSINGKVRDLARNFDKNINVGQNLDGKRKQLHVNLGILGPSGFIRIKKNNAISFGVKARAVATFNDINQDFVYSMYNHFEDILQWLPNFTDERATAAVNVYHEFYAGYARSFKLGERHALHIGATAKMTTNVFNAQFVANNLNFNKVFTSATDSFINVGNTTFDLKVSNTIDDGFHYKFGVSGFGFDVGAIYEYKLKNSNDHFIMVGASVNDLGFNTYTLGKNSRSFIGNGRNIPAENLVDTDGETINLDAVLDSLGTRTNPTGKTKIKLPTTLNVFADVRVVKMFYINANFQFNPYTFKKGTPVANLPVDITITPRFESRIVSVYMPINYNQYSGFNMGAGLRVGQFTLGSSSIITSFAKKKFTGVDFYMNVGFGKSEKGKKAKKDKTEKTTTML
ncbi:MAG: hypothetical protein IPP60_17400 [Sphingobacteriales bacterium]|nr:hypothetical protein [Sphingobacteriales bacterium]